MQLGRGRGIKLQHTFQGSAHLPVPLAAAEGGQAPGWKPGVHLGSAKESTASLLRHIYFSSQMVIVRPEVSQSNFVQVSRALALS